MAVNRFCLFQFYWLPQRGLHFALIAIFHRCLNCQLQRDGQTDRQTERRRCRETDRSTDRRTELQKYLHLYWISCKHAKNCRRQNETNSAKWIVWVVWVVHWARVRVSVSWLNDMLMTCIYTTPSISMHTPHRIASHMHCNSVNVKINCNFHFPRILCRFTFSAKPVEGRAYSKGAWLRGVVELGRGAGCQQFWGLCSMRWQTQGPINLPALCIVIDRWIHIAYIYRYIYMNSYVYIYIHISVCLVWSEIWSWQFGMRPELSSSENGRERTLLSTEVDWMRLPSSPPVRSSVRLSVCLSLSPSPALFLLQIRLKIV